ncbi:MAG: hypothetical protein J6386_01915 [Candidatus Synoicihabitans palmerolidicus]|nr:hypothetical protein [Candidatus Synoicihabitans palmerolidicus]
MKKKTVSTISVLAGTHGPVIFKRDDGGLVAFGWWALLAYLSCSIVLEALHGFKVGWYLDVGNETRRLMLTLGHAHGSLLALVTVMAGVVVREATAKTMPRGIGWCIKGATCLLPAGFLLAGLGVRGGDPGPADFLVPVGAGLLLVGVARMALASSRES